MLTDLEENMARARAAREALVGKTIADRYVLRGLVGHGGMGAVYEAERIGLGERVAIKFVDPEFATDENVVARFAREARAMSAIKSAHIVTVLDAGSEEGRPYLVMELLRGEDLGERLRRMGRIPLGEAMHIVAQVLKGLAVAHAAGIVHRDLKPDNVFLVKQETDPLFAKIVDFGVSKIERPRDKTHPLALTGRGTVLGTPFYMSPEQAQASSDVDARADVYSVGAILFECLTGRPPHTGESYEQVILSICMRDAPSVRSIDASIPADVSELVSRALARDCEQRFGSAERMLAAVHEVAPDERGRVPLESLPATLASPGARPLDATIVDSGPPNRSSQPSWSAVSVATQLGVATLKSAGVDANAKADAGASARADADAGAKADADASAKADAAKRPSGARLSGTKNAAHRPIGLALATAVVATLTGVGVTFGVISLLDRKVPAAEPPRAESSAMTSASSSAPPATPTVTIASATTASSSLSPAAASASAAASAMEPAAASQSAPASTHAPAGRGRPRSNGATTPALSRPSSTKPLDIQRDLP